MYNNYNNYDDNVMEEELFNNNSKQLSKSSKTMEETTNDMLKLFVRENKTTVLKDLTVGYVMFMKDINNSKLYIDSVNTLKNKYNAFMIDVYYDYRNINKSISEAGYLRYANGKLNELLKQRYLVS